MTTRSDESGFSTREFVARLVETEYRDLPDAVTARTKQLLQDFVGVAIAGQQAPHSDTILEFVRSQFRAGDSTLFGTTEGFSPTGAALANGATGHAWDLDDTYDRSPLHTSSSVVPAAVALAEHVGASGRDLLLAVALGMDVQCRLGLACERSILETGWHRTATLGTFGAATAGAIVLGLDDEATTDAMSLAYSQAAGSLQPSMDRAYSKRFQPGHAARAGVTAALLAARDFPATEAPLEGDFGFFDVYEHGDVNWDELAAGAGRSFLTDRISIKRYPCCRYMHTAIDAGIRLHEETGLGIDDVERAEVEVSQSTYDATCSPAEKVYDPSSSIDLQFDLPYGLLVGLDRGDFFIDDVVDEALGRTTVIEALPRVEATVSEDLTRRAGGISPVRVEIETTAGTTESTTVERPRGHPDTPLTKAERDEKFRRCLAYGPYDWDEQAVTAVVERFDDLESLADVRDLLSGGP